MEYIKVFTDFQDILAPLSDEEAGRLFRAMLHYAETGEVIEMTGNERFMWIAAKRDIDVLARKVCKQSENGKKGGRPQNPTKQGETQQKPIKANESQQNPIKATESQLKPQDKTRQDMTRQDMTGQDMTGQDKTGQDKTRQDKTGQDKEEDPLTLTEEDVANSIKRDSMIEEAAQGVGLQLSEKAMLKARNLCEQYGTEEVIKAINASVDVPKWAYVEGILRNGGVKDASSRSHVKELPATAASQYAFLDGNAV